MWMYEWFKWYAVDVLTGDDGLSLYKEKKVF